jgi:hypothetical protein
MVLAIRTIVGTAIKCRSYHHDILSCTVLSIPSHPIELPVVSTPSLATVQLRLKPSLGLVLDKEQDLHVGGAGS